MSSISPSTSPRRLAARLLVLSLAAAFGVCGCTLLGSHLRWHGVSGPAVELGAVPFYPQDESQSGPAALAMDLAAQGIPVNLDALIRQVHSLDHADPPRDGLAAAARNHGLVPYEIQTPHIDAGVAHEIMAGHPVLVLQNLASSGPPNWHFAIVIGVDPQQNTFFLRSGSEARQTMSDGDFVASLGDGGNWAMVAAKPEDIPATADADAWLSAVAPFEQIGKADIAEHAYAAAAARWPQDALVWEALAHARHSLDDFLGSSQALFTALKLVPGDTVVRHNFAYVLMERRCPDQAQAQIDLALAAETDPRKIAIFRRTKARILDYEGPSIECPGF